MTNVGLKLIACLLAVGGEIHLGFARFKYLLSAIVSLENPEAITWSLQPHAFQDFINATAMVSCLVVPLSFLLPSFALIVLFTLNIYFLSARNSCHYFSGGEEILIT